MLTIIFIFDGMFNRWIAVAPALIFVLLQPLLVVAQPKCTIEHLSTLNGLSDNRVMCIMKDREGFLWMGTWTGINRYDGHNFITYKSHPGDRSELNNNRIDVIVESNDGMLWLKAYDNQVYRFDKRTQQFLSVSNLIYPGKQSPVTIHKLVVLQKDRLALLTKDKGFFLVSGTGAPKPSVQYFAAQNKQLPSDSIDCFHQDNTGRIWAGSRKGLSCLQPTSTGFQILSTQPMAVSCMAEDSQHLWFGSSHGEITRLRKSTGQRLSAKISNARINAVFISRNDKIYVTTQSGALITMQPATLQVTAVDQYKGELLSVYEDQRRQLWLEPAKMGVVLFQPAQRSFKLFTQPNYTNYLHDVDEYRVFEDNKGIVWINFKGSGFGYYDTLTNTVNYFYNEAGAPDRRFSNMVSADYYDSAGILWLSSDEGGLEKIIFQPQDFTHVLVDPETYLKAENDVRGLYIDKRNRLWIGTKGRKLKIYENGKPVEDLFDNRPTFAFGVYTILEDRKGNIWLGTKGDGLYKATPLANGQYHLTHYLHDDGDSNSLSHNQVYSLLEDQQGRIWAGTFGGGINLINGDRFRHHFKNYPAHACKKIRHLASDAQGRIWIGTTEGLLVFDPNQPQPAFARYGKVPGDLRSLGDNDVQFVYRSRSNTMWVLTSSGGLNKAIGNGSLVFRNFSMKDGLPSDYLFSCVEDRRGALWIATQNGLSTFEPVTGKFRNFNVADGLPNADFAEASCAVAKNGELVFGTIHGYIQFNPETIVNKKVSANMALINLRVNGEEYPVQDITLRYDQNLISIDYTVLDHRFSGKESYAYRLTGFEKAWHDNKSARRATYTNLPPGNYTFEVKSTSEDLYTNVPIKRLNITILPPPWKTWWAYCIYLVVGAVLFWVIRKNALTMLRLRQRIIIERKLADFRLNFFTNISHELRTPLTLIMNPLEEIAATENLSDKGTRHLHLVRKNARRLNRFINQLLDLRKAQSGQASMTVSEVELVSFTKRIAAYFTDLAEQKNITLSIEPAQPEIYCWMDAEKMDIVIYNVLANAFKFTPNGKRIRMTINNSIELAIIDEGIGVPENELTRIFDLYFEGQHKLSKGTGIGLALSKEFVQLNHGVITAINNQPQGLIVTIKLLPGKGHFEGVTFSDSLPDLEKQMPEETETFVEQSQPETGQPLLLLVEDNTDLRSFLKDQLGRLYRVETAANGEEGLQKAIDLLPDVVLSDVMMPVMNGITMLDKLKNNPSTSHIPVVLLSARYSIENRIEGLQYGADQYLAKPFSNELLVASLNNLLIQRKRLFESKLHRKEIEPSPITITSHDEQFLQKLIAIVEDRMADSQFNIDVVAESMNMSRSPFYKKLKSLTGFSPVEFVREIRLKRSLQLLQAGETNIATIAYEVGFSSAKYFSTCFKQRFGSTPSDYLRQQKTSF